MGKQQKQTLSYFSRNASDWQRKSLSRTYSTIDNRHNAVMEVLKAVKMPKAFLDVGCGTGQLAIAVSKLGIHSRGVDFSPEMIQHCVANNRRQRADAEFACASIFDLAQPDDFYDVISAQGFIEYISFSQLDKFLDIARGSLRKHGALAVGSRNRLFNAHSFNKYTELEIELGSLTALVAESIILQSAKSQKEALKKLSMSTFSYRYPRTHPVTGIGVDRRYQFSPADLAHRLEQKGFKPTRIFPVHYHAFPLSKMEVGGLQGLHNQIAGMVSRNFIREHSFVPYSSSFVLEAIKQ